MPRPTSEERREHREKLARVTENLAALAAMSTADLAARFEELTGRPARSRNHAWLRKRVAWYIQAAEYGGLSEAAVARAEELAPLAAKLFDPATRKGRRQAPESKDADPATCRDPRIPPAGTVLRRIFRGATYEVTVLDHGFEYRGGHFRSLSKVAKEITGTPWNGFAFFGCRAAEPADEEGSE